MDDHLAPKRIGFVLTSNYALMSLASAVEPLRAANDLAGRELYRSSFYSVEGGFMPSTAGGGFDTTALSAVGRDKEGAKLDLAFVVAGGNPMLYENPALVRGLRSLSHRHVGLGGISGGAAILARGGLLSGRRFTVHWAHIGPLAEHDPELLIERALYVIDRDRYTCAGGVASLDMMCAMIAREHGSAFARDVSDWFIHPRLREADEIQQGGAARTPEMPHAMVQAAVDLMGSHLADPLSIGQISELSGGSERQLQRLFGSHFGMSTMAFYRRLRLAKADELLQQSTLPILDIAVLTGFASTAHLSRCFAARYGMPPGRRRKASRQLRAV